MTPTFPPSPAQGETAGVSEQRIRRLIDDLQSQVDDLVRNGETHTGARYRDTAAALRELLAARQQLAELQRRIGLPVGVLCDRLDYAEQQLAEIRGALAELLAACTNDVGALRTADAVSHARAALAPTSQPSRGKCETCGGRQSILQPISKTARNPAKPDELVRVQMFVPCPDCAQPERQGAVPSHPLVHRWYGSPPNRGDYLYLDGKEVAYLGDQHHEQVSNLVYWINKAFMEPREATLS